MFICFSCIRCLPYEQITSYESLFKEGFPSFENFYSQLKSKNIDKEVYNHTKMLWNEFDCQTLLDLLKIYQTRYFHANISN